MILSRKQLQELFAQPAGKGGMAVRGEMDPVGHKGYAPAAGIGEGDAGAGCNLPVTGSKFQGFFEASGTCVGSL